jgi:phosphatidylserine synthase 2
VEFRDGIFIRPHPVFWRLVLGISVLYQMGLVLVLFQTKSDARFLLTFLDDKLNVPLRERSYADNCDLNLDTLKNQVFDEFVLAHVLGWFGKSIIIRDYWFCWILSVMFEVMEYSLQHQLPNFAECWWDHWILDVLVCNWLGIWAGMKTCEYLEMKTYSWRGIYDIPTYRGKIKRTVQQFTPHSWTRFEWAPTDSLFRYGMVIFMLAMFLLAELNSFYLKYLLWLEPPHWLNIGRLVFYFFAGIPATREMYQYISDPECKRVGVQTWLTAAAILTEFMIILKFSQGEFPESAPFHIVVLWTVFLSAIVGFALWRFWWSPQHDDKVKDE